MGKSKRTYHKERRVVVQTKKVVIKRTCPDVDTTSELKSDPKCSGCGFVREVCVCP